MGHRRLLNINDTTLQRVCSHRARWRHTPGCLPRIGFLAPPPCSLPVTARDGTWRHKGGQQTIAGRSLPAQQSTRQQQLRDNSNNRRPKQAKQQNSQAGGYCGRHLKLQGIPPAIEILLAMDGRKLGYRVAQAARPRQECQKTMCLPDNLHNFQHSSRVARPQLCLPEHGGGSAA